MVAADRWLRRDNSCQENGCGRVMVATGQLVQRISCFDGAMDAKSKFRGVEAVVVKLKSLEWHLHRVEHRLRQWGNGCGGIIDYIEPW